MIRADHVFVCGGAVADAGAPAAQRHPPQRRQRAQDAPDGQDRRPLPPPDRPRRRARCTASPSSRPASTIGGSASRRGHVALALADTGLPIRRRRWPTGRTSPSTTPPSAATAAAGCSPCPGCASPLVTYRLTDGDLSRLARGLVHLGELLLAAGATELYPSIVGGTGGPPRRRARRAGGTPSTRRRANLMTVHLTSTVRMGEDRQRTGADSFGRVWGHRNLRVNDASLLPDAPGVNPQAAIMAIAARNADAVPRRRERDLDARPAPRPPVAVVTGAVGLAGPEPRARPGRRAASGCGASCATPDEAPLLELVVAARSRPSSATSATRPPSTGCSTASAPAPRCSTPPR